MIGRRDCDFRPAEQAQDYVASDRGVIESGRGIQVEQSVEIRGRRRTFLVQKFPLRDDEGAITGVCGIATDISERTERDENLRSKVEWSFRIRGAIERDRLVLHSQPIVEAATGRVVQEELLVRMLGEDDRLIMPGEFLPPAERFELAPAIDRWVIARAAELARDRRVEVNLSGQSIGDPALPVYVEERLAAVGADPSNLVFEITERRPRRTSSRLAGWPSASRSSAAASRWTTSAPATAASPTSGTCRSATSRSTCSSCASCDPTPPIGRWSARSSTWRATSASRRSPRAWSRRTRSSS